MDTVKLLNSYRMAVTRDRDAVRVLAFLHRDGPQDEAALADKVRSQPYHLRAKLTDLYRANLVALLDATHYGTTELAEQVLAQLGIADVVAREAISNAALPDDDRLFLMSCVSRSEGEPIRWRRYLAAAIRSASELAKHANLSGDAALRTWYGAVTGLDPVTHELGPETFSRYIAGSSKWGDALPDAAAGHFIFQCKRAIIDRTASNEFLTRDHIPKETDATAVFGLSFIRLFASVTSQVLDDGVAAAVSTTGLNDAAVNRLATWSAPFERTIPRLRWTQGREVGPRKLLLHYLISHLPDASAAHQWTRRDISREELRVALSHSHGNLVELLRQCERQAAVELFTPAQTAESLQIVDRLRSHLVDVIAADAAIRNSSTK